MNTKLIDFIKQLYGTNEFIPLHAPRFSGNEKKYVAETVDSTFVSSVGAFVTPVSYTHLTLPTSDLV